MSKVSTLFKNGHPVLNKIANNILRVLHFICKEKAPKKGAFNRLVEKMGLEPTTS